MFCVVEMNIFKSVTVEYLHIISWFSKTHVIWQLHRITILC